jgi:hypothetical protein
MKSFWPLDLAVVCLGIWVASYVLYTSVASKQLNGSPSWPRMFFGIFLGMGGFCAACTSCMFGWYFGLEFFLIGGAMMTGLIAALMGFVLGFFTLIEKLASFTIWRKLGESSLCKPFVKLGKFLNADDVPR